MNRKPAPLKAVKRNICGEKGCMTDACTSSMFGCCFRHSTWKIKICVNFKTCLAKRNGGICRQCYKLHNKEVVPAYCVHCQTFGYKRIPRKEGGMCTVCIGEGIKLKKKCIKCDNLAHHKGGYCVGCYNHQDHDPEF